MEYISFDEILEATGGEIIVKGENILYNNVSIDTREIKENDIFIALKGENFNANDFTLEASSKGASICIVDEIKFEKIKLDKKTSVIKVEDTKKALLNLAKFYINKLNLKVVGITGSTGKTSTKDLVAAVLSAKYKVFKTLGNFNNEIGLPMMIFKLDQSYDIAVLEMGMSDFGEIHNLCEVARPDIAIITNIGMSHIENLKTRENILKAKMEITDFFDEHSVLIVNADNDLLETIGKLNYKLLKTGIDSKADFKACDLNVGEKRIAFNLMEDGKLINEIVGLEVNRFLSGPLGGDQQIGAKLAQGEMDMIIFLRDPLTAQAHEPDISALLRLCDVHCVPLATNLGTSEVLMRSLKNREY